MKTKTTLLATGLVALVASAVAHADKQKHEEKFCASLSSLKADLGTLDSMSETSTMGDLRAATEKVRNDANDVMKEARRIKTPTANQFSDSANRLQKELRDIPGDITIAQAKSRLAGDIQNLKQSTQQLEAESGCASPAPAQPTE